MPDPVTSPNDPPAGNDRKDVHADRSVLEKLAFATLKEQRAARRWRIFFRLVVLIYIGFLTAYLFNFRFLGMDKEMSLRHTALINLEGVIDSESNASAEKINLALDNAFKDSGSIGVILKVNSPGGSPVQAGMIHDEIKRLRAQYPDKPLYIVVEEMCASGGYYVAAAADQIFVDKASIIGSIGVLMDGFGFTGAMQKFGVERRLLTAGRNKGIGDPFSPETPEQKAHFQRMLDEIHQQFIKVVREGRGKRLRETADTFSGLFWSGAKSVEIGLADGFGTVDSVARDVVKAEDVVDYTEKASFSDRLARRFGAEMGTAFAASAARTLGGSFSLR